MSWPWRERKEEKEDEESMPQGPLRIARRPFSKRPDRHREGVGRLDRCRAYVTRSRVLYLSPETKKPVKVSVYRR